MSVDKITRHANMTPDEAPAPATEPASAPTASALQNPYRRIFTDTPDFATLARRAYDAEKADTTPENDKGDKI